LDITKLFADFWGGGIALGLFVFKEIGSAKYFFLQFFFDVFWVST